MKRCKTFILTILLVATLVPTQAFHYIHVFSDLSEHYGHHSDKSVLEFLAHAMSETNQKDSSHPDHHHSPFQQHSLNAVCFISTIPDIPIFKLLNSSEVYYKEKENFHYNSPIIEEITSSIWQPPKLV